MLGIFRLTGAGSGASVRGLMAALALPLVLASPSVRAEETSVTEQVPVYEFSINGRDYRVARRVAEGSEQPGEGLCPPDCIQPIEPVRNIRAVGELELLAFLTAEAASGNGVVIDARLPQDYALGTIPGAVNVPWATLDPANTYRNDILVALGAQPTGGATLDFTAAVPLILFGEGPTADQAVRAIRFLREAGYPVDRLLYYRGGLRDWQSLGLTVDLAGGEGSGEAASGGAEP